jgi:hypothetical protein
MLGSCSPPAVPAAAQQCGGYSAHSSTHTRAKQPVLAWLLRALAHSLALIPACPQTQTFLVTPAVVREVRALSGCATLAGAALEDEGGVGTAVSHWEMLYFEVGRAPLVPRSWNINNSSC